MYSSTLKSQFSDKYGADSSLIVLSDSVGANPNVIGVPANAIHAYFCFRLIEINLLPRLGKGGGNFLDLSILTD